MGKQPNRSDKAPEPINQRVGESPFAPGQKVMLMGYDGRIDRVVTIVEILPLVPQCWIKDGQGRTYAVAESRLRCE